MKILIPVILLLFFAQASLQAQELLISQPQDFNIRNGRVDILGKRNGDFYAFIGGKRENKLQIYNQKLGMIKQAYLDLPRRAVVEKAFLHDSTITVFIREKDKQDLYFYARQYTHDLNPVDTTLYLDTLIKKFTEPYEQFFFLQSEDKSKLLVYYFENNNIHSGQMEYLLLSKDLELLQKGVANLPLDHSKTYMYDIILANDGSFYPILVAYEDASTSVVEHFYVVSSTGDFKITEELTLFSTEKEYLNNAFFKYDNVQEEIKAAGFYTTSKKFGDAAEGIFFKTFSSDIDSIYFSKFDPEFVARLKGSKKVKENDRLFSFRVDDMILRSDGGAVLIAESIYQTYRNGDVTASPYGYGLSSDLSMVFHYDELLLVSVGPQGEIDWKQPMHKMQSAVGDLKRYASYTMLNSGYKLIFLYNDQIDDRANLIQYEISGSGEYSRKIAFNSQNHDVYVWPDKAVQTGATEIVLPSYKKGSLRLVKLSY